jgi:hemerythrin-like domain-containing protein
MMRDPIDGLLSEHREIMAEVAGLRHAVRMLAERGDEALADALPALRAVGHMMGTRLLNHARKEDEALFPALERFFGTEGGPTYVMRQEHRDIHSVADLFRRTLRELNEVEHPAIVESGAKLRGLAESGGSAAELRQAGDAIVRLLDSHFDKEEAILFPMARQMLSPEAMQEVARKMDEIETAQAAG